MSVRVFRRCPFPRSMLFSGLAALSAFSFGTALAGPPQPRPRGPLGCGKAQALAGRFLAEEADPIGAAVAREAMGETDVLHYDLDLEISNIDPGANTCTITGVNVITIQSKSPALTQFTFRLRSNYTITSALVNGATPVPVTADSTTTRHVDLDRAYGMDELFTLTLAYNGPSVSRGFGSIDVGTQFGTPVVATLSEPYYAYTWWPAKDGDFGLPGDSADKATLDIRITAPNNFTIPSNGVLQSVEFLSGNRRKYHWRTDYPIATYLVCFAATNYNTWTVDYNHPGGTMPVEFFIYPGNDSPPNRAAWERAVDMLATFRPLYGEYPFLNEKYGIYNFNFGGGMEHQTMTGQGTFIESVTAHELVHQWWGDMITCRTWSDIWLNEGFATYGECLWEEFKNGFDDTAAYLSAVQARRPSGNGAGNTVYVDPADMSLGRIFDYDYSYLKGCWVLHQLRGVLGDDAFFDLLAAYRAAYEFSAATTDEFATLASSATGIDLTAFFDQWVYSPGAPSYQYGWQSASVAGQDYLLLRINQTQTGAGVPAVFVMPVELHATIGSGPVSLQVQNDARTEWFVVPVAGPVSALQFDPDQWILRAGASSQAYVPGPPRIVETIPPPGAEISDSPPIDQITIRFHTAVNATAANFSLTGEITGARSFTLASGANVNPVVLNLDAPLPADNYWLSVTTGVTAANSGMALDGEIADPSDPASLPSGDGLAGGDALIQFTVTPSIVAGDIDGDGDVDETDRQLFIDVLLGLDLDPQRVLRSDLDGSGAADGDDIAPFVAVFPGF